MNLAHVKDRHQDVNFIAIGICRTAYGNTHTGVAYRDLAGSLRFFHQAFHYDTRNELLEETVRELGGPFFCIAPAIEEDRARAIAGFWQFVAAQGEKIGYALRDDAEALFDENTG